MGAKISKRGSYNLKKREKKSKRNKLEGRTSSIINLTLSQIYEDELKTPKLDNYEKHKDFDHIYENQNPETNLPTLNTIQNINNRSDSERDDYSNPDDERIYENIIEESNSNFEEQERKKSKTGSQSEVYDDKHLGVRNSISEESGDHKSNENWKEILNGGFWKNENNSTSAEQIEVIDDKNEEQVEVLLNNQNEDLEMKQLEVNIYENEKPFIDNDKEEQLPVTEVNQDLQNHHNEEQIEVVSENNSYEQIEVKTENIQQNNLQEAKPESVLDTTKEAENTHKEIKDQTEKNALEEKVENIISHTKNEIKESNKEDITVSNHEANNSKQSEQNINNFTEEENKISEKPQSNRQLSKTVSGSSEAFYEIASEGWAEDSDLEFYDAEDFQNEAQIEVVDEVLKMNLNTEVPTDNITVEVKEIVNQIELENSHDNLTDSIKVSEELIIDTNYLKTKNNDSIIDSTFDTIISDQNTDNTIVMSETSLILINNNEKPIHELNSNEGEAFSLLIDINEDSKPVEPLNQEAGFTNSESSSNEKDASPQADLLIDLNEETPSVDNKTDNFQKQSTNLELNNELQEISDKKDTLENQFVSSVETDTENKNNVITKEVPVQFVDRVDTNTSNVNHIDDFEEPKSSNIDLQNEPNKSTIQTINKVENLSASQDQGDRDNLFSPSEITVEDIAKDQMKIWERHDQENEEAIFKINAIINSINEVKLQIDNSGSTEKDQESEAETYQKLIKLMRDVNTINNYNFNEKIIKLQNVALSEVHNCLKTLQMKNI